MKVDPVDGVASRVHGFRPKALGGLELSKHRPRHVYECPVLRSLHTTAKWCGREEEHDAHRYGEDYAWRVQDPQALLVGSREHGLPRHQPGLPSPPPQEDFV